MVKLSTSENNVISQKDRELKYAFSVGLLDSSPRPRRLQSQAENSPNGGSPRTFEDSPKGGASQELRKSLVSESSLGGGESLREIWQLIDENRSPTPRTGKRERGAGR